MNAHYLQHVPFEGLGSIHTWLDAHGWKTTATRLYQQEKLPSPDTLDFLIVMGGPMSVNDESRFPWLVDEKRFIRRLIESGKPVLGICLGAQLIAAALGARVYPNAVKEIGWLPVSGLAHGTRNVFVFPSSVEVFHWHGETFDLPEGAIHIARSEACANQGFQLGSSVIGLQFHLETTPESAAGLIAHCRDELVVSPTVQSEAALQAVSPDRYRSLNALMDRVLSFLTGASAQTGASENR